MAGAKEKTTEQKERDRDKRYRKAYRIGLDTRNEISTEQENKCGICGRPESDFTTPLQVDHEHFRVDVFHGTALDADKWVARAMFKDGRWATAMGPTQKIAKERVRNIALPMSIRGLLCPGRYTGCNRLLGRIDNIEWLRKVIGYLENPPAKKVIGYIENPPAKK